MIYSAGLDAYNRPRLSTLLQTLHSNQSPRVLMALRPQDPIPEWISHVAVAHGDRIHTGPKDDQKIRDVLEMLNQRDSPPSTAVRNPGIKEGKGKQKKELISLRNVSISYGERHVSLRLSTSDPP